MKNGLLCIISVAMLISVKDLKKFYGEFAAVKGVSFDVKKGEVFGILDAMELAKRPPWR